MTPQSDLPELGPTEAKPFVEDYFLYLLAAVSDRAHSKFHAYLREAGLKIPEWRVLACLSDEGGAMITRLAELCLFEQSRLTKIVQQMEGRGLVTRKADAEDARRVRMYLTEEGRRIAEHMKGVAKQHEAEVLALLDEPERSAIKTLMKSFLKKLEADRVAD